MARSGITKREVQAARLALLKAGHHPSIDAIRIHLGNTGSKSTISRLVKEIEDEEGGGGGQAPRTPATGIRTLSCSPLMSDALPTKPSTVCPSGAPSRMAFRTGALGHPSIRWS